MKRDGADNSPERIVQQRIDNMKKGMAGLPVISFFMGIYRCGFTLYVKIIYPSGMKVPGRARCKCFLDKYIHHAKTGKCNRDEYIHRLIFASKHFLFRAEGKRRNFRLTDLPRRRLRADSPHRFPQAKGHHRSHRPGSRASY